MNIWAYKAAVSSNSQISLENLISILLEVIFEVALMTGGGGLKVQKQSVNITFLLHTNYAYKKLMIRVQ